MSKLTMLLLAQLAIVHLLFMPFETGIAEEKPVNLTANGQPHVVEQYSAQDQCQPLPGHLLMHFHRLVLHLDGHRQFCEGEGLLICFPGQLDRTRRAHGPIVPDILHRLRNIKGNEVAQRCGNLTSLEQCGDKCEEQPAFHGLLLKTNSARDVTIQLSTSNATFTLHREQFEEWLVWKLASPRSPLLESFLSRTFGPMRDFLSPKRDGKEREEARERIHMALDDNLRKAFAGNSTEGAPLRNYVGLWSLGWDLLPTGMDSQMVFLTERDEQCCEMEAFYLSPTVNSAPQAFVNANLTDHDKPFETLLADGLEVVIRGRVKDDAKWISFEMEDLLMKDPDPDLAKQVRIPVVKQYIDFVSNTSTFIAKYNETCCEEYPDVKFVPGKHFHMKISFKDQKMHVLLDCRSENEARHVNVFNFYERLYRFKISGELELLRPVPINYESPSAWYFPDGIPELGGLLFRGQIKGAGDFFKIKLWGAKGEAFVLALDFAVDVAKENFFISHSDEAGAKLGSETVTFKDRGLENSLHTGTNVELYIHLEAGGKSLKIWLNSTLVEEYKNEESPGTIKYAQASGNVSIEQMDRTGKFPIGEEALPKRQFDFNDFVIKGRMISLKEDFQLSFFQVNRSSVLEIRCSRDLNGTFVFDAIDQKSEESKKKVKPLSLLNEQMDFVISIRFFVDRSKNSFIVDINGEKVEKAFVEPNRYNSSGNVLLYNRNVWRPTSIQ